VIGEVEMKKSKVLGSLIHLIVLALFNALYFGIGGVDHPASAWISYGFIHFSYVMVIITPYITQKGKDRATYAASMYTITSAYFAIELIVGAIIIIVAPEGHKFSLFSQLIMAAIYLIILFGNMIADEHTAKSVEKHEAELIYVKESCSMLKAIMSDISDEQLYRKIEKAYDLIQSSPVKSATNVLSIESQVISEIDNLGLAVRNGDATAISASADKIARLANERNRLLRLSN
jgi:hypothetical protein